MKIKDTKIYTVLFTFGVTFVFVLILAYANNLTKDRVKKNQELFQITAILDAMQVEYTNGDHAYGIYQQQVTATTLTNANYTNETLYSLGDTQDRVYALVFTGDALWGSITGVLSVDAAISHSIGLSFIDQNETPGLGGRITEDWFLDQFAGESILITNEQGENIRQLQVLAGRTDRQGDTNKDNATVDGISGASITSGSVEKAVNKALPLLVDLIGELNHE